MSIPNRSAKKLILRIVRRHQVEPYKEGGAGPPASQTVHTVEEKFVHPQSDTCYTDA